MSQQALGGEAKKLEGSAYLSPFFLLALPSFDNEGQPIIARPFPSPAGQEAAWLPAEAGPRTRGGVGFTAAESAL